MAVTCPNLSSNYPEFSLPATSRHGAEPLPRPRPAVRPASAPRTVRHANRRVRRTTSLAGLILRSRLMDDVCAVLAGGAALYFIVAFIRMLLGY